MKGRGADTTRWDAGSSDGDTVEAVVEASEIVRVGRDHPRSMIEGGDRYGGVDDIGGRCRAAELSCGSGAMVVKDGTSQSGDAKSRFLD